MSTHAAPDYYVHASGAHFQDSAGRAIFFRGVNLSGSAKAPVGQPTQQVEGFWDSAESGGKSFVGQPLDLQDGSADVHLSRLRLWGFNCLRFIFTWEALEHQGPGKYDYAYIDYVVAVLRKCKEYGFRVYMDPHQDVFSRFTGGSGAPYWTLPACGIDHRGLSPTQAAFLHSEWPSPDYLDPATFPDMLWATNYTRLAPATLSALFFAGHDLAPKCRIDGKPISTWLQDHFFAACRELSLRIRDAGDLFDECVIGWDSLNEPNPTYVGLEDIAELPKKWQLRQGPMPTPIQSMALGVGKKQCVQNWSFGSLGPKRSGEVIVDPQGASIWLTPDDDARRGGSKWGWKRDPEWPLGRCVWEAHGVWDSQSGKVLLPDYFRWKHDNHSEVPREPIDFIVEYWLPFWRKYAAIVRAVHSDAIMFIQPPVFERPPTELSTQEDLRSRACVSCHFYDGLTLITKHWNWFNADTVGLLRGKYSAFVFALRFGSKAVRKVMRDQLEYLRHDTLEVLGQYPTIIGEIGIPFDLDKKRSYLGDARGHGIGDYSSQSKALDASLSACDGTNLLSYTLWTYCPDNVHAWGDNWNGEDLSVWCLDDRAEQSTAALLPDGGRELSRGSSSATLTPVVSKKTSTQQSVQAETISGDSVDKDQPTSTTLFVPSVVLPLINGTRAAPAFYRPYPIAVAGKPLEIDFEIASATFKLAVEIVYADADAILPPTEIFVPLIHYAEDESLAALLTGCSNRTSSSSAVQGNTGLPASISVENFSHTKAAQASRMSKMTWGSHIVEDDRLPPLALEVTCSSGTWTVQGQVLKWWPKQSSAGATEGSRRQQSRQEIVIRRRGGPIKSIVEVHAGGSRQTDSTASGLLGFNESFFQAWADACCIM